MVTEMLLRVNKFILFFILNLMLLILLYSIPINSGFLSNICIFKFLTGKECWNCGMTRAFLSILHLDLYSAIQLNPKVIIVFPSIICVYLYSWFKYIFKKGDIINE